MTVSTETTKSATVVGNGVTTAFPFAFKIFQTSDVSVVLAVVATGVETVLTEGVDYSVSMNADQEGDPGGEVTYPLSGSPMASTHSLTLVRDVPATQGLDLTLGGPFNPDNIEKALDRVTTLVQQLKEAVGRAVKVPVSSGLTPDEFFLDNITNAEANANAAAGSAAAAAGSAAAALASEIAAAAAAEDFRSRYVGASATDPTVDGNGDALTEGDLYWNTAVPEVRVYSSGSWIPFLDPGPLAVTPFAETLLDDANATAARQTLGFFYTMTGGIQTLAYTSSGQYISPNTGVLSSVADGHGFIVPYTGFIVLGRTHVRTNSLDTQTVFMLVVNGVAITSIGSFSIATTGASSSSSISVPVTAGDRITIQFNNASTPTAGAMSDFNFTLVLTA